MSFYAYEDINHTQIVYANKLNVSKHNNIFYCPNNKCNCQFKYRAVHSNRRKPHFYKLQSSQHINDCWSTYDAISDGYIDNYNFSDFSEENMLNRIITPEKKISPSIEPVKKANHEKAVIQHINTIRQLYSVCMANDNDTLLGKTISIKQIFCGRKTAFLYTRYIKGIKLVECSFHSYNKDNKTLKFKYPYSSEKSTKASFYISLSFSSEELFWQLKNYVYNQKDESIFLIYANFGDSYSNSSIISNKKQIIALKNCT